MCNTQKIKVCHFSSVHQKNDNRILEKECVSLADNGFEVYYVCCAPSSKNIVKNVTVITKGKMYENRLKRIFFTSKEIFKTALQIDADIYHFHDPELLLYAKRLKKKGKIIIYDTHEDVPKQIIGKFYIKPWLRSLIAILFKYYEDKKAKQLDAIITATPSIKNRFEKINKNTVDINNYPRFEEIQYISEIKTEKRPNTVCYAGGITKIRGISELIEAMSKLTRIKLHLLGNYSPESYRDELAKNSGFKQVVEHGFLNRKAMYQTIASSMAGIILYLPLPNHIESQPNKFFEYMAAGVPIIGSHYPLWKEILTTQNCGICVDPTKPEEIAKAIQYLIDNPEKAIEMGKNGRKAAINQYNWAIEEKKLIALYNKLSQNRPL